MPSDKLFLLFEEYKKLLRDPYFRNSVLIGLAAALLSGFVTALAKSYADQAIGSPVGDFLLDNLPTLPFFWFLIWGTLLIAISIAIFAFLNPVYWPAVLKSAALLYFIRAIFISLTHLK